MAKEKDTQEFNLEESSLKAAEDAQIEKLKNLTFKDLAIKQNEANKLDADKRALRLVRCTITSNDPDKRNYAGEIFCARNAQIDDVKKFVQFNVPTHVPQILLNVIQEKMLQTFVKERLPNGHEVKKPHMIKAYNVHILDPLTPQEFEAIKQKQLAEGVR